jgi:hypothetical protein
MGQMTVVQPTGENWKRQIENSRVMVEIVSMQAGAPRGRQSNAVAVLEAKLVWIRPLQRLIRRRIVLFAGEELIEMMVDTRPRISVETTHCLYLAVARLIQTVLRRRRYHLSRIKTE